GESGGIGEKGHRGVGPDSVGEGRGENCAVEEIVNLAACRGGRESGHGRSRVRVYVPVAASGHEDAESSREDDVAYEERAPLEPEAKVGADVRPRPVRLEDGPYRVDRVEPEVVCIGEGPQLWRQVRLRAYAKEHESRIHEVRLALLAGAG